MKQYYYTQEAQKKLQQRHQYREDVEGLLQDEAAQVVAGTDPGTFVHQRVNNNGKSLLRVVVGAPRHSGDPWSIITLYYTTKVSKYWNKNVVSEVCKAAGSAIFKLLVCQADSFLCCLQWKDETEDQLCHAALNKQQTDCFKS